MRLNPTWLKKQAALLKPHSRVARQAARSIVRLIVKTKATK